MRTADERRSDSFHEAGHAVLAVTEGVGVSACFLDREGGETHFQGEPTTLRGALAIAVAGVLAESGSPPRADCETEAQGLWSQIEPYRALLAEGNTKEAIEVTLSNPHDALDVAALLHGVNDEEAAAELERGVARAQEVLAAEWPCVELVAVTLRGADA